MTYRLDVFSPETYQRFAASDRTVTGVKARFHKLASSVQPGDLLLGYITKLSRWCAILQVTSEAFEDATPRFMDSEDPFVIRFQVKPLVFLPPEQSIPIQHDTLWDALSFTRDSPRGSTTWTGHLRTSMVELPEGDGKVLHQALLRQAEEHVVHPLDDKEIKLLSGYQVKRVDGAIAVTVPDDDEVEEVTEALQEHKKEVRESIKVQAMLARIGAEMSMQIWIPANDRAAVLQELGKGPEALLASLPLNYDSTTIDTIQRIDVLWIKGRSIVRAFEVEHTTSIYSGILRMADLLSLQPNMDIRLHIVAPEERRNKVMNEIQRPVFSLIEGRPLKKRCTFLSYDSIRELAEKPDLEYTSEKILSKYEEFADE